MATYATTLYKSRFGQTNERVNLQVHLSAMCGAILFADNSAQSQRFELAQIEHGVNGFYNSMCFNGVIGKVKSILTIRILSV